MTEYERQMIQTLVFFVGSMLVGIGLLALLVKLYLWIRH